MSTEKYKLEEVTTPKQIKEFINLPKRLYADNPNWVCPLDDDIQKPFDPTQNPLFEKGKAIRWIVRDETNVVVGRIAAFYNTDLAAINDQPTGGCGFFESIDDQQVANILFDSSKLWLQQHGMEAMDGPINFGDRDQWWGLLVNGFEFQPLYANPYNLPYYQALFENYGFQVYFNQHTYIRNLKVGDFNKSVYERVKRLEETPGYRFAHINKKNLSQVTEDFRIIYNKAWALFTGVKTLDKKHAQDLFNSMKVIIDEKLIYFSYFNDEPIGFFIMVPDLNRIIGKFNGKLNWINKLRLMWDLKFTRKADRVFGMIFGVSPEYHGKGIESGMMHAFERTLKSQGVDYKTLELAWIGDFNPVMMRMVENYVCAQKHKMHVTYRVLFDPTKEFKRCPRMGVTRAKKESPTE